MNVFNVLFLLAILCAWSNPIDGGVCEDPMCSYCPKSPAGCGYCYTGYTVVDEQCQACNVTDCTYCFNNPNKCGGCRDRMIAENGRCESCPDNCRYCGPSNKCSYCFNGFQAVHDGDTNTASCKPCVMENCLTCKSDLKTCTYCRGGYVLKNGQCEKCEVDKCMYCHPHTLQTQCSSCERGYGLSADNSRCVECDVANCTHCYRSDSCSECKKGMKMYYQSQQKRHICVPIECTVENCVYCKTTNTCRNCMSGHTLINNTCVPCNASGCSTCFLDQNKCDYCLGNRAIDLVTGNCFFPCYSDGSYCDVCSADRLTCLQCKAGMIVDPLYPTQCVDIPPGDYGNMGLSVLQIAIGETRKLINSFHSCIADLPLISTGDLAVQLKDASSVAGSLKDHAKQVKAIQKNTDLVPQLNQTVNENLERMEGIFTTLQQQ